MLNRLKSRKLWAGVAGAAIIAFGSGWGLPEPVTTKIAALVISYIVGQSIADAAAAANGKDHQGS